MTSEYDVTRRQFLAASAGAGATVLFTGCSRPAGKRTFTILHTNDLHSNLIGMAPASDYSPFVLNDDKTRGGFARLATLMAQRKAAREADGPVLILDAGDYSMGTAFAAAIRETGGELQLLARIEGRPAAYVEGRRPRRPAQRHPRPAGPRRDGGQGQRRLCDHERRGQ